MNVYTEADLRDLAQDLMACQAPRPGDRVTAQRIARIAHQLHVAQIAASIASDQIPPVAPVDYPALVADLRACTGEPRASHAKTYRRLHHAAKQTVDSHHVCWLPDSTSANIEALLYRLAAPYMEDAE